MSQIVDAYDVATIRALEERAFAVIGADTLMQRAAYGLSCVAAREAVRLRGRLNGTRIFVLVGPGNNGGDALFAGARLARRGARVTAIRCLGSPHGRGLAALLSAGGRAIGLEELDLGEDPSDRTRPHPEADLVLDGVLGIGGRPGLPARVGQLAEVLAGWLVPTIAVDLPSGVSADTGAVPGSAFTATRTVTFGAAKPCHLVAPARSRCGVIDVVDIGLDAPTTDDAPARWLRQLSEEAVAALWPWPDPSSDKYSRGVVGVDTGSDTYPGAGVLSTYGAVHAGAGMVRFVGADVPAGIIRNRLPNVVFSAGRVQAHLVGSGWGERAGGRQILERLLDQGLPTVVDADGLRHLPKRVPASWLLTPHAGELARLVGRDRSWVSDDPFRAVTAAADATGATVLLKGATQLVATPGGSWVDVAVPGPAWTGQAGSGDVLGGICATLLAAGLPAPRAAGLAASIQALTAAAHPGPVPPQRLAELLPAQIGRLQAARAAQLEDVRRSGW